VAQIFAYQMNLHAEYGTQIAHVPGIRFLDFLKYVRARLVACYFVLFQSFILYFNFVNLSLFDSCYMIILCDSILCSSLSTQFFLFQFFISFLFSRV
jgi:hypothetical protein